MGWWILLPIFATILYVVVVALWLPKFFLQNKFDLKIIGDRGVRKYKCGDGARGIAYEPDIATRKYIKQYVILDNEGEKTLKCMIAENIYYIAYDIVIFDVNNEILKVLNISDVIEGAGYTQTVVLPKQTSYVTVVISTVNEDEIKMSVRPKITPKKVIQYSLITMCMSVVTAFAIRFGISYSLGGVFRESFMKDGVGCALMILLSIVLTVVAIGVVSLVLVAKNLFNNKERKR